jgi:hypothetical protein
MGVGDGGTVTGASTCTGCDSAEINTLRDGNSTVGVSANAMAIQQHQEVKFNNNCITAVTERAVASEHVFLAVVTLCLCTRTAETFQLFAVERGARMNVLHH